MLRVIPHIPALFNPTPISLRLKGSPSIHQNNFTSIIPTWPSSILLVRASLCFSFPPNLPKWSSILRNSQEECQSFFYHPLLLLRFR